MSQIKLVITVFGGKGRHKSVFAITDDRCVVSDRVLLVKVSRYVGPVSIYRDIEHRSSFTIIVFRECDLNFVLTTVVILTMTLCPVRDDGVSFRTWNVVRNKR